MDVYIAVVGLINDCGVAFACRLADCRLHEGAVDCCLDYCFIFGSRIDSDERALWIFLLQLKLAYPHTAYSQSYALAGHLEIGKLEEMFVLQRS